MPSRRTHSAVSSGIFPSYIGIAQDDAALEIAGRALRDLKERLHIHTAIDAGNE